MAFASRRPIQDRPLTGYDRRSEGKNLMAEAEDPDQDRIEKFEVTQTGDTFTLMLKSKSEEFEFLLDRDTMQELADEIYYFLDKDEPKKA
jgi:hypothetical protein